MFPLSISLTPSTGVATTSGVARVFEAVDLDNPSKRNQSGVALGAPCTLTISHQQSGSDKALTLADRHLIRIDQTFPAVGLVPAQVASAYLVIVAPRNTVTAANVKDIVGALLAQTNTVANLDRILNNEP